MAKSVPPVSWFRAFEAAARRLSFTGAAEELGLTQSAISQHVRSLELRFGVRLFERKPRGLALTDEGRRMFPDVSRAIETLSSVSQAFDHRPKGRALTIATSVSFAQWYLAPSLEAFQREHDDLSIRIITTTWPDEYHRPLADVEIRFGPEAVVGQNANRLQPDDLIIVAAPSIAEKIRPLETEVLIEAVGTSDGWKYWAEAVSAEPVNPPRLKVESYGLAVDLATCGAGVALTSAFIAAPGIAKGTLKQLDFPSAPANDGYFLAVSDADNPDSKEFSDWLTARLIRS